MTWTRRTPSRVRTPARNRIQCVAGFAKLADMADELRGAHDTKLAGAITLVQQLLDGGHQPIVFCRFINTAEYIAEHLTKGLTGNVMVSAVTGRVPSSERERRVAELAEAPQRVLVATDCLSEGINLQEEFTAVLHYDLPWNPTASNSARAGSIVSDRSTPQSASSPITAATT